MAETTTIYVTKGAETHGIRKVRAVVIPQGMACLVDGRGMALPDQPLMEAGDFRNTLREAQAVARASIVQRVARLKKEIATLEAINLSTAVEG